MNRTPRVVTPVDVGLAVGLAALGATEAAIPLNTVMGDGSLVLAALLAVVTSLALVTRRLHPLLTLLAVMLPWAVFSLLTPIPVLLWGGLIPMGVAMYSVARHDGTRAAVIGACVGAVGLLTFTVGTGMIREPGQLVFPWLVLATTWTVGRFIRRQDLVATISEERALAVEAESREQMLAAVAEERTRIARELHDTIAHTVTTIVVQAGAAGQVVEEDPAYVRACLDRIRQSGSEALDDMRRVVSLLRRFDDADPISPQPGLSDVARLVGRDSGSGAQVHLEIEGEPRPLPPGADVAAYRIIQESLTNAHRHAAASEVRVTVRYRSTSVELDVSDNGLGGTEEPAAGSPRGHGLIGIRERVAMYGGQVHIGPMSRQGFRVRAVLPVAETQ